ncbi:DUF262 domain-containing protein [Candidatus Palauibacter sp.]|uniref:DUF262 domain-containing protein n=1 Tax=Candidatus Palauibacter sp. TaxID=3101350 RepID=UPI003B596B86
MTRIQSEVRLLFRVLCSAHFEVPWHQRHYDWTVQEVGDLLEDLMDALDSDKTCYFLGSIMLLKPTGAAPWRINDGQQRLITFSLLMAAFCRRFSEEEPRDTWRETSALRALFDRNENEISRLDDAHQYTHRIAPPKDNRRMYTQLLHGHDIGSNGLMTAAWNKIDDFVDCMDRETREAFFDFLLTKLEVSVLTVPGDVDANSVFETLNARGKSLSDVDLIRNLLYSCFSEIDDTARRNAVHANLQSTSVILNTKPKVSEYFRCYLQCRYGFLRKKRFYREFWKKTQHTIRGAASTDYAYSLVAGLGRPESTWLFQTIISAKPSQALEGRLPTVSGKRDLAVLLRELQGYKVSHPLCFALLHRFMAESSAAKKRAVGRVVGRSLKNLTSYIMRAAFVTSTFRPSRIEEPLAMCAQNVFVGTDFRSLDIMAELEGNDPFGVVDDASFIRRMTDMELRSNNRSSNQKALRYLFGINAQQQRGSDALQIGGCSVEHVLPQSEMYWPSWTGFKGENPAAWVHRTGNFVVVSRRENRGGFEFNANFAAKRRALAESPLLMARNVAEDHEEWTPAAIEKRSEQLAVAAAGIWTFRRGN